MIPPVPSRRALVVPGWLVVAALAIGASVLRVLSDGQDLNFDLVTYHYYLGFSALSDRTSLDFLPASFQGYQSPLPYVPLYWLDSIGVPPALNAALHATLHASNLVVLYFLCQLLVTDETKAGRRAVPAVLWLLGAVAPVYWQLVGTSFADLTTSALVLSGLWLTAIGLQRHPLRAAWKPLIVAGALLIGMAIGMRLHNAIYLAALCFAVMTAQFRDRAERLRVLGIVTGVAAAASGALLAPWGWRIFREFGNPVFPFFNGIFRSPDFPAANLALTNFVPERLVDWLSLPFRIGTYGEWIYVERNLPDVRPALLVVAAAAYGSVLVYRRLAGPDLPARPAAPARDCIIRFFAGSAALWLATSCNGRYGVSLFLLGGPVCGALLLRLLPMRHVILTVAAVVAWQVAVQQAFFALPRWAAGSWSAHYFDWDLPDWMTRRPAVFLTFGYQTASTLAPVLHPLSNHVNLVGQYSIGADGPGSSRVQRLIQAPGRSIYGVFDFRFTQQSEPAAKSIKAYFAEHLQAWGLGFTDSLCTQINLKPTSREWGRFNRVFGIGFRGLPPEYIVCELRAIPASERDRALRARREFQDRLTALAEACPLYLGVPLSVERRPGKWYVTSFRSLEFRIEFDDAGPVALQRMVPPYGYLVLGELPGGASMPGAVDCREWRGRLASQARERSR